MAGACRRPPGPRGPALPAALVALLVAASSAGAAWPPTGSTPGYPAERKLSRGGQPFLAAPAPGAPARFDDLATVVVLAAEGRHHYAKSSPWNADGSLALLVDGTLLDGRDFRRIRKLDLPAEHRTWANADPDTIYGVTRSGRRLDRWVKVSARTNRMSTLATYPEYGKVSYGEYEGNTDNEDRLAVLVGDERTPFVIEARTGAKRCEIPSRGQVSDATVSQDGAFVLVNWERKGVDAYDASCRLLRHLSDANSHYDACVLADGETQVMVQPDGRELLAVGLADGKRTTVYSDSALRIHISCRNIRRPGWAYVSPYGGGGPGDRVTTGQRLWQRGFAVRLDGSERTETFAWLHLALPAPYEGQPMMVPSPRGDRVWWKVDWDGASGAIHSYVAGVDVAPPPRAERPAPAEAPTARSPSGSSSSPAR